MSRVSGFFLALLMSAPSLMAQPVAEYGGGAHRFSLATGSPGELGLLKALGEAFAQRADASLVWVKAGTGQSLNLLKDRKVDMAMVHAPPQVDKAVAEGWAVGKTLIGSNEFYIVGPVADPAGIREAKDAADAYARIAKSRAKFVSRGDNSGTHQKEMQIWGRAGVEPVGDWYIVTKDFMTASLKRADAENAYFMSDSSTWIMERGVAPSLKVLYRGDKALVNTYHALLAPSGATAGRDLAEKFVAFLASPAGQEIIREYGRGAYSESLYNDSEYARRFD